MISFILFITLLSPAGESSQVIDSYSSAHECAAAVTETEQAMHNDGKGWKLVSVQCVIQQAAKPN